MIVAELTQEKLTGAALAEGAEIRARVDGTASQRDVGPLDGFLGAIHAACLNGSVETVVVDVRALAYVSSSHFKVMVSWIGKMRALPARVRVRLLSNEKYHWQKRSLYALQHLAEEMISIEPA